MDSPLRLKKMRLFQLLNGEELHCVAPLLQRRPVKKGETVIEEGGRQGAIYIVEKGLLKVTHVIRGRRRELGSFRAGDHFGEISFIDRKARSATIHAAQSSKLLVFTRAAFEKFSRILPEAKSKLYQSLLEDLCAKLRDRKFSLDFDLSDMLPVAVFETDRKGNMTFANRNGLRCFQFTQEDFENGLNIFDLLLPVEKPRARKQFRKLLTGSDFQTTEYIARKKEGDVFPVLLHADSLETAEKGLRVTILDVTIRRKAEEKLLVLEKAVENMQIGVSITDPQGKILYSNPAEATMHGYKVKELIGRDVRIFAPRKLWRPMTIDEVKKITNLVRESVNIRKDGTTFPVQIISNVVTGDNGQPIAVVTSCQDIRDRKQAESLLESRVQERTVELVKANRKLQRLIHQRETAEKALRSSEERYRAVVDQASEGIFLVDPKTRRILNSNPALRDLLGYTEEEMAGKTLYDIVALDRPAINRNLRKILNENIHQLGHRYYRRKDGSRLSVEVSVDRVFFAGKEALCTVVRDVSERERAEKEKRRLEENLRRAQMMEAMGQLVSGVAHEVRNPLNAIQATAEALRQDLGNSAEHAPFLDAIHKQVVRLSDLMRELLELGRPADAARMSLEPVSSLVSGAVQLWRQTMGKSEQNPVVMNVPEDIPEILVDAARVQQVLINLLDNAAQHSPPGSSLQLVGRKFGNDEVELRIIDQGVGVPPENLARLFEPFFTTRRGGIGLGLSLVKHIVEGHQGSVQITNNDPSPGCTVEIRLKSAQKNSL